MSWVEQQGEQGNREEDEREFISPKIGTEFEGTFRRMTGRKPSKYDDGFIRYAAVDLTDGRKVMVTAGKILLERLEAAGLVDGDRLKVTVESAVSKGGNTYALPRVYVDRQGGTPAPAKAAPAAKATPVSKASTVDDEDLPF